MTDYLNDLIIDDIINYEHMSMINFNHNNMIKINHAVEFYSNRIILLAV